MRGAGYDRLWLWFGLSRASFLVLPRVLMHEMPDKWQTQMAKLLEEYDETFPNTPAPVAYVMGRRNNRFAAWPDWLLNYRRPDKSAVDHARTRQAL